MGLKRELARKRNKRKIKESLLAAPAIQPYVRLEPELTRTTLLLESMKISAETSQIESEFTFLNTARSQGRSCGIRHLLPRILKGGVITSIQAGTNFQKRNPYYFLSKTQTPKFTI
jgi:hypothetical protein